ncbi:unnamed protein product [Penicillium viridicatum]
MYKPVENLCRELAELIVKLEAMEAMEERGRQQALAGSVRMGFNLPRVPRLPVSSTVEDFTKTLLAGEESILTLRHPETN